MKVLLKSVRIAFPNIFEAQSFENGKPAFNASYIIDPDSPLVQQIEKAMKSVAKAKWGDKAPAIYKSLKAGGKLCLRDGDEKAQYAGFEGNMYLSARNEVKPPVVDRDGKTPLTAADGKIYSGSFVYAEVEIWAQQNSFGKRINASLLGIQREKDGDAFSGGAVGSADAFDDLGDLGEEDDFEQASSDDDDAFDDDDLA